MFVNAMVFEVSTCSVLVLHNNEVLNLKLEGKEVAETLFITISMCFQSLGS